MLLNMNKGVTAKNQIFFPGQGLTDWLGMTDSKGRKIAMWGVSLSYHPVILFTPSKKETAFNSLSLSLPTGNLNADKNAKGTVVLDYDMCVDLMLMIKNGNSNAIEGGCGLTGGWLPYGGNSGIHNSAATSAGVVSCFLTSSDVGGSMKLLTDFV